MGRRLSSSSSQLGKGPGALAAPSPKPMRSLAEALDRSAAGRKSGGTGKSSVINKVCSLAPLSSSRGAMDKSGNRVMSISERSGAADTSRSGSSGGAVGAEPQQRQSPPSSSSGGGTTPVIAAAAKNLDASVTSSFRFGDGDSLPSERENATPPLLARPVEERIAGGGAQSWSGGVQESRVLKSISCGNENGDRSGRFRHSFETYKAAAAAASGRNNNNNHNMVEAEEETFQDRALRFQAEDWALLSERWREGRKVCKDDSKASSRKKGGVLSPSASSECSSSLFSTIDSTSSLSSRSEASSFFLKGDGSPASVIPVLHCPRLAMPPAMSLPPSSMSMSQQQQAYAAAQGGLQRSGSTGGRCSAAAEGKDKVRALLLPQEEDGQLASGGGGSFLEFDFRGGRMVESQEPPPASGGGAAAEAGDALTFEFAGPMNSSQELERPGSGDKQCSGMTTARSSRTTQSLASFRHHHHHTEENAVEDDVSASGFATPHSVFFSATTRSPESVFCSPDQRLTRGASLGSETEMTEYLIDRSNNEWDLCRYDSDHDRRNGGTCRESLGPGTTSNSAAIALLPTKSDDASLRPLRSGVTRHTTTLPVKGIVTGRPPSSPQVAAAQAPEALLSRTATQPSNFQLPATGKQSPLAGAASSSDWAEEDRPLLSGASEHSSRHPAVHKENGAPSSTRSKKSSASPGATTKRSSSSSPLCVSSSKTCPSPSTNTRSLSSPMPTKGGGSGAAAAAASKISGSPLGRISSSLVQGLRTTSSSSSPARRNLYSTFKDSKLSHAIHDTFHPGLRGPKTEIPQQYGRASMSPVRSWLDPVKESRASILASWASMSGGQSEAVGLRTSSVSDSGTDLDSRAADVGGESHRRGSKLKNSFRRKENRGALATLYRVTSPVVPRPPRLSSSSLKHNSYGELLKPLLPAGLRTPTTSAAVPSAAKLSAKVSGFKSAHSLSQRVHSFVSRSSTSLAAAATTEKSGGRVGGQMQCVYRDGAPSYSLVMDDTEEMFVAKLGKSTDPLDVYNDLVFTIYRWKGKARGKSGWRSWGKKDKPVCEYVGKLRVASTLCDETSCSGEVKYYVESECVLVDVLDHNSEAPPHSGVLTVLRSSQLSASAWDSTPGRSPWLQQHYSSSPASSSYFSPLGPASFGSPPPVHVANASSQGGGSGRNCMSSPPDEASKEAKENSSTIGHGPHDKFPLPLDKPLLCGSRVSPPPGQQQATTRPRRSFQDLWSDSDATDEFDMRPSTSCPSHTELAAVVIRTPVDRDLAFLQGANLAPGEKTGWGLNFLRRRTVRPSTSRSSSNATASDEEVYYSSSTYRDSDLCSDCGHCYACGSDAAPDPDLLLKCGSQSSSCASDKGQQRRKLCDLQKMEDNLMEHGKVGPGELMVNVILPAGTHTFTSTGVAGPQPLISRWRAGGKCDCGNWDEGCGLTVLETKLPLSCDPQQQQQQQHVQESSSCKIYTLGKKDQIALDISQQGHQDGMFSVSFKEPMDSVQAFATAVAVLRCREPFLPVTTKRAADPKRKPPRFPLRQVNNGNEANLLRQIEGQINMTGGGYFVSCPADPPLSPYHHRS